MDLTKGINNRNKKQRARIIKLPTIPVLVLTTPIKGDTNAPPTIAITSKPDISFDRDGIPFIAIENINGNSFLRLVQQ